MNILGSTQSEVSPCIINPMIITDEVFQAFIKCETKSYLKFSGAIGSLPEFSDWQKRLAKDYEQKCFDQLSSLFQEGEYLSNIPLPDNLENENYRLILGCTVEAQGILSRIHAVERLNDKPKRYSFIPIRFVINRKITIDDKLLLAFDALTLHNASGKEPLFGKIIYGDEQTVVKVKLIELIETARSIVKKIAAQQTNSTPPILILNKHCAECEFREQCRQVAIEKDELSLLSSMTEKERNKLHNQGISSITQLSYTFRPRRKPRRLTSKENKYSHALKALAIRENKIHVVGKPELKINGNLIYLDVEGSGERDFYYLIGLRIKNGDSYIQHSFWADDISDEEQICTDFLHTLADIENPQLIHYGSYDSVFLMRMKQRYGYGNIENSHLLNQLIAESVNLLSVLYANVYFPTYSNGLKEVARYLGFQWSESEASGINTLVWRSEWERSKKTSLKDKLITYNAEDCEALEIVASATAQLCKRQESKDQPRDVIYAESIKGENSYKFRKNNFSMPELEYINQAAYWDYQREKVYIRSNPGLNRARRKKAKRRAKTYPINKVVECEYLLPISCPKCSATKTTSYGRRKKIIYDLKFGKAGVKRWVVKYVLRRYKCRKCGITFTPQYTEPIKNKYGSGLLVYAVYQMIEMRMSQRSIPQVLKELYGLSIDSGEISRQKIKAAMYYENAYESILKNIVKGQLIHADETKINIIGGSGYVWVLANMDEVAYIYTDTREGDVVQSILQDFNGVLVSDFYVAYDPIDCAQQKCLIHLIRDLNDDFLKEPFNGEMKELVRQFTMLLRSIIATVDQRGLKARFLRKHKIFVERLYKNICKSDYESEIAIKWKKRFNKNRNTLFTFLDYDGIPWNNNNAEYAIKAFARLRRVIGGSSTSKGIREYLILLSIYETCKYRGISFLDFLRSGEEYIDEFTKKSTSKSKERLLNSV